MNVRRKTSPPPGNQGFSLVELMLVLLVAAILAAIALPAYTSHVARARRVAGRAALVQAAHWLERAATATGSYPLDTGFPAGLLRSEGAYYLLSVKTTASSFVLGATPTGPQSGDRCGTLGLLETGERTISNAASDATVDACWNR